MFRLTESVRQPWQTTSNRTFLAEQFESCLLTLPNVSPYGIQTLKFRALQREGAFSHLIQRHSVLSDFERGIRSFSNERFKSFKTTMLARLCRELVNDLTASEIFTEKFSVRALTKDPLLKGL